MQRSLLRLAVLPEGDVSFGRVFPDGDDYQRGVGDGEAQDFLEALAEGYGGGPKRCPDDRHEPVCYAASKSTIRARSAPMYVFGNVPAFARATAWS